MRQALFDVYDLCYLFQPKLCQQILYYSQFSLADASYPNLTEDYLNKLERHQNLAILFIFNLCKYDHVSEFRSKLKWLPIRSHRNLHTRSLLYCVLHNEKSPYCLKEMFEFLGAHTNRLRSSENLALRIPRHSPRFYEHSFAVRVTKLWNDLPLNIRRIFKHI